MTFRGMTLRGMTVVLIGALAACGPRPRPSATPAAAGPTVPAAIDGGWQTLRAEHRVTVEVTLDDGKRERRSLRGVVAVQQPDRIRLRALGPGGITLFDLLSVGGRVKVLESVRQDVQLGQKVGVTGTPTYFINGIRLGGFRPAAFDAVIAYELKKAGVIS